MTKYRLLQTPDISRRIELLHLISILHHITQATAAIARPLLVAARHLNGQSGLTNPARTLGRSGSIEEGDTAFSREGLAHGPARSAVVPSRSKTLHHSFDCPPPSALPAFEMTLASGRALFFGRRAALA